jgi:uncharacterized membrane protein
MAESAHLWAIGFPDVHGADRFRNAVTSLAAPVQCLLLRDLAVLVRERDGSYTLDRQPFPAAGNVLDGSTLGFLAGIALSAPLLTATAVGDLLGLAGRSISGAVKIDAQFIHDIQAMLQPGTSAVLMLDLVGDLQAALEGLRGLGGTILKTNVDVARAELLQSTLRGAQS